MNQNILGRRRLEGISTVTTVVIVVVVIIAAVAAGVLFLTSTTTTSVASRTCVGVSSSGGTQIIFGATLSMTGTLSAFGQEQNWTLSRAISDMNSFGGITLNNGSHVMVKLIVLDDKTDPTTAASNLQTLVSQDKACVILGELGGVQDSTAQSFATQNQVPYIGPVYLSAAKNSSNAASNWIFAPFQNETNEAHIFLNWFHNLYPSSSSHNLTIAFFGEGDPAALYNNKAGEAYARQLGYTVCSCSDLEFTPGSQSEMTTFIQGAISNNASAVYGLPLPPDAVLMANTAKSLNYEPKAWMLTRGTAVAPFAITSIGGVGNESQGFMSSFPWNPLVPYKGNLLGHTINNSQIVNEYEAAFQHPPTLEGVYYTEALVAADAIAAASSLTNGAIRQALLSGTFQSPMGTVSFTPGGQWVQSQQYILLMQWQNRNIPSLGVTPTLQILEPQSVNTTSYEYNPFVWYSSPTNQPTTTCPC